MVDIITAIEAVTPDWLTAVLGKAGALPTGRVTGVEYGPNPAFNSRAYHLVPAYSPDAPSSAPERLFLKLKADHWGEHEVGFYRLVVGQNRPLPMVVRCYDTAYDPATGASHCLLHDLSASHGPPVTREQVLGGEGVPSRPHLDQMIDALAAFHAHWWEHPVIGPGRAEIPLSIADDAAYRDRVTRIEGDWHAFISAEGDAFPGELRGLYEHALSRLPGLWDRYLRHRFATGRQLTLIHGDCYLNQFLCPREPEGGRTYMADFDSASGNLGADDLVFMFATFWTSEMRRADAREESVLRRYHEQLVANGVAGYALDDLWRDYRVKVAWRIFHPVWDRVNGSSRSYWWPKMQCLTGAYGDLRCAELLDD